jgi:hypothetical protein
MKTFWKLINLVKSCLTIRFKGMVRPLNSLDIFPYLKKDTYSRRIFKNVVARDRLPKKAVYPSAYVINTDNSNGPGEHWLAVYYDSSGYCTFFDSFARSPNDFHLDEFLNKTSNGWEQNTMRLQDINSVTCGYYCVYFVLLMSRGLQLEDILALFEEENFVVNDLKISKLML